MEFSARTATVRWATSSSEIAAFLVIPLCCRHLDCY